jgi:hypothetical protein
MNDLDWEAEHVRFMTVAYARTVTSAKRAFWGWHSRKKDDAIQECLAKRWDQWSRLLLRGRDPNRCSRVWSSTPSSGCDTTEGEGSDSIRAWWPAPGTMVARRAQVSWFPRVRSRCPRMRAARPRPRAQALLQQPRRRTPRSVRPRRPRRRAPHGRKSRHPQSRRSRKSRHPQSRRQEQASSPSIPEASRRSDAHRIDTQWRRSSSVRAHFKREVKWFALSRQRRAAS